MSKSNDLLARVNGAIQAHLESVNQRFRGTTQNCLTEEDVVSFCLQTVKQRLTQRQKGKEGRDFVKMLKTERPDLYMQLKRHRGE